MNDEFDDVEIEVGLKNEKKKKPKPFTNSKVEKNRTKRTPKQNKETGLK